MERMYGHSKEDNVSDQGHSISLQSNKPVISAKDILKKFGFTPSEIEMIESVYGEELYQAAENAERFSTLNLGKDKLFQLLMLGKDGAQNKNESSKRNSLESAVVSSEQTIPVILRSSHSTYAESDIDVDESNMPGTLKEGQFDIFLLFTDDDVETALRFKYFLETKLSMTVCYLSNNFGGRRSQFDQLEDAIKNSLYTFIWVTKNLIGDNWLKYKHDAALAHSIQTNGEFVVPVRAEKCDIPFSLQPLTPLRVFHVINGLPNDPLFQDEGEQKYQESSEEKKHIPFLKNQINKLVWAKEGLKKRREQMDKEKKEKWRKEERMRLYMAAKEKEIEDKKQILEQDMLKKAIDERIQAEKQKIGEVARMMQQSSIVAQIAMLRQTGMNELADNLQRTYFENCTQYFQPVVNSEAIPSVHYHLPNNVNPVNLAPSINIQVQQMQNMQLGDHNRVAFDPAPVEVNTVCPDTISTAQDVRSPLSVTQDETHSSSDPSSTYSKQSSVLSVQELASEEDSGLSLENVPPLDSVELAAPRPEDEQTVVKRQHTSDSLLTDRSLDSQISDVETAEISLVSSYTGSEFTGTNPDRLEDNPPENLRSLSVHNYNSATEHLPRPPVENDVPSMRNPLSLVEGPPEQLDDTVSIRSLSHPQRPCQSNGGNLQQVTDH